MFKESLRDAVLQIISAEFERQTHAALDARDESISEESRAENKYDTHAQEAAYLAEGQARLVRELHSALAAWRALVFPLPPADRVQLGSLVTVHTGRRSDFLLLGPTHGGLSFRAPDEREIMVVTPASPLGRSLLNRGLSDVLTLSKKGVPPRELLRSNRANHRQGPLKRLP